MTLKVLIYLKENWKIFDSLKGNLKEQYVGFWKNQIQLARKSRKTQHI